jgi:hypothetical protein
MKTFKVVSIGTLSLTANKHYICVGVLIIIYIARTTTIYDLPLYMILLIITCTPKSSSIEVSSLTINNIYNSKNKRTYNLINYFIKNGFLYLNTKLM